MNSPKLSLLVSAILVALFSMVGGCSPLLVERLSTGSLQFTEDKAPSVHEHPVGHSNPFGVDKRLIVTNPTKAPVRVSVRCTSMFQGDMQVNVAARSERYLLVTAGKNHELDQTCFITEVAPR